MDQTVTKQR